MPSVQVLDVRDNDLLIRYSRLVCGSYSSGQCFAFSFLPTVPHGSAVAVQLIVPPVGSIEDVHLQAGVPCRAHHKKLAVEINDELLCFGPKEIE